MNPGAVFITHRLLEDWLSLMRPKEVEPVSPRSWIALSGFVVLKTGSPVGEDDVELPFLLLPSPKCWNYRLVPLCAPKQCHLV